MTIITSTNQLPPGWMQSYCVHTEEEAAGIAKGQTAYLYQSKVINAFYLFIPAGER